MEDNKIVQGQQEDFAEEMQEAQKNGIVSMEDKKKEKKTSLNYTHTFKAPVEINGQKQKVLTFYFEKLTGEDVEAIEEELQNQNKYVLTPEVSSVFQTMLAARAAGVGADEIRRLPLGEYMKIKNQARSFLIESGY
ncbi:phage tail assembly protein [Enterocloster bolteae]|uniref:phage tail assembly protein n=1 Tax=Enterocloster bolteae TaxID=208479 RepID=UPI00148BCC05|nr:phage tail assembly protein [Enterocloster bolteae]QJU19011.1 phage tail assembly protein [Enterocloster bolteae]